MRRTWIVMASVLLSAACGTESEEPRDRCQDEDLFAIGDATFCVVVEEGFLSSDCPEEYPHGRDFDGVIVCGEEPPPDEARDELEARGLLEPECEPEGYVSTDPACAIASTTCAEGEEAFKDECGCGCRPAPVCTEGDTRQADCNTCTCEAGAWTCTEMACACSGDDVRPYICNTTCSCVEGAWACPDVDCSVEECVASCGDGCPAPELQLCGEDGQRYCNVCVLGCVGVAEADDPSLCPAPTCEEACGVGCPAPEFQLCGADGSLYCNACLMACAGVTEAPDRSACDGALTCLEECGVGCPAPEFQLCGADGSLYCTACTMACAGVEEAADRSVCDGGAACVVGSAYDGPCGPQFVCVDGAWVGPTECDLFSCGMACDDTGGSVCGADGNIYVTDCWRRCAGVPVASDASICVASVDECAVTDPSPAPVEWAELGEAPEGCTFPLPFSGEVFASSLIATEEEFLAAFDCAGGASSGIDWGAQRVYLAHFADRTSVELVLVSFDGTQYTVHLAAPAYCGGARPPGAVLVLSLPAGPEPVAQTECTYGRCPIGPPVP